MEGGCHSGNDPAGFRYSPRRHERGTKGKKVRKLAIENNIPLSLYVTHFPRWFRFHEITIRIDLKSRAKGINVAKFQDDNAAPNFSLLSVVASWTVLISRLYSLFRFVFFLFWKEIREIECIYIYIEVDINYWLIRVQCWLLKKEVYREKLENCKDVSFTIFLARWISNLYIVKYRTIIICLDIDNFILNFKNI